MKKFSLLVFSILTLCSCSNKQLQVNNTASLTNPEHKTPALLQCEKGQQWISFDTGNNKPGSLCIDKASFFENGRYKITLFEKGKQGYTGGVYFIVEGDADFNINEKGHHAVTLHPQSGWRKQDKVNVVAAPLDNTELQQQFATTYLWEKIDFPQMPSEDFLILAKPGPDNNADKNSAVKLRLQ